MIRTPRPSRRPWIAAIASACLVTPFLAACGNLTAGGFGDVETRASADADETGASPAPRLHAGGSERPAGAPLGAGAGTLQGDLDVEMQLWLIDDGDGTHLLTPNPVRATLDLGGAAEPVASRSVAAGRYVVLRVLVSELSADVEAGLLIDGLPFIGSAQVAVGSGLAVDLPIDLEVQVEGRYSLLLDFGADEWLLDLDPITRIVAATDVATRIHVVP
jgi:hypothetical protein